MEETLAFLESMRRSKANNESIRDEFLKGYMKFGWNGVWEKPADTAAEYDRRAQADQEIIEMLEAAVDEAGRRYELKSVTEPGQFQTRVEGL